MIIQQQEWGDHTTFLIVDLFGSVQLRVYDKPLEDGSSAIICSLWVEACMRRRGVGTTMLSLAEGMAKARGHSSVTLFWKLDDSTRWVYAWYLKNGYKTVACNPDGYYTLKKNV